VANELDKKSRPITTAGATGLAARFLLIAGSVFFSLGILEIGVRLMRSGPEGLVHWPNFPRARMGIPEESAGPCIYAYDAALGWKAPGNCVSPIYNSDADGFRGAPATAALAEPPILATGASFTKGDEVGDGESWPAYLQALTGRKVLNAGVSGYSFDQTVLSTEAFARRTKPLVIVVSFTPDDIRRSEYKVSWSREKPYFEVVGDRLELRNVPVPGRPGAPVPMPLAARLLGWSALADEVAKRLGIFQGWYYDEVRAVPPGTGPTIACLLMPKLAALGAPVVVMAQYGRGYWRSYTEREKGVAPSVRKVLGCAADAGLIAFDLADPLKAVIDARGLDALYRTDHHATAGNRIVAELLMQELIRRGLLSH
jgi:hypothetical protein